MTPPRRLIDLYLIRYVREKMQLLYGIAAGVAVVVAARVFTPLHLLPGLLCGWDAFMLIYLCVGGWQMHLADEMAIRDHAHLYDDGEFAVLVLSIFAAILSMVAIIMLLAPLPGLSPSGKAFHTVLSVVTLATSWIFIHTVFAFHYAHGYYFSDDCGRKPPLVFPNEKSPLYTDFLYFSFVIGTSGQTADVAFASTAMRRVGLLHCVVAYVFNAAVLGLSINIAAGIIGGK